MLILQNKYQLKKEDVFPPSHTFSHPFSKQIQSTFNGSNTFGTMKISSRQG